MFRRGMARNQWRRVLLFGTLRKRMIVTTPRNDMVLGIFIYLLLNKPCCTSFVFLFL